MAKARYILGLAASHNGAACLLDRERGAIDVAIQEERLTRRKRAKLDPAGFAALDYVLAAAGIAVDAIDTVAVAPLVDSAAALAALGANPRLGALPHIAVAHHRAHAAAAFALAGVERATVLVVDGAGAWVRELPDEERALVPDAGPQARETVSIYRASRTEGLAALWKDAAEPVDPATAFADGDYRPRMMPFTSLGVMYQSVAQQIFGAWDAAGKVMGLAPFGTSTLPVEAFVCVQPDGRLAFPFDAVADRFRDRVRWPERCDDHRDLAASVQRALEHGLDHLVGLARRLDGAADVLCYAGGVALNSVANARVVADGRYRDVSVMAAAEDAGTALGAALLAWWGEGDGAPSPDCRGALATDGWGRTYPESSLMGAIDAALDADPSLEVHAFPSVEQAALDAAQRVAGGAILGVFQGRSELGPRALGQRSIVLDPRRADGKDVLNAEVKHREPFRPFAPAILEEAVDDWFARPPGAPAKSPHMLHVWPLRSEKVAEVPAVAHCDGTGRVQTVGPEASPWRTLIEAFADLTGVPLLLNTSFNVAGEPIVETPEDALRCMVGTGLDGAWLGRWLVCKP